MSRIPVSLDNVLHSAVSASGAEVRSNGEREGQKKGVGWILDR